MLDSTNIMPISGIKKLLSEKILIAPIKPPSESEPVSPIKTFALLTLKTKKASMPPIKQKHIKIRLSYSSLSKYNMDIFSRWTQIKTTKNAR